MSPDALLTVAEVAERLSVNPQTVRNWIARDELKAVQVGSRRVRITPTALDAFIGQEPEQPVRPRRTRKSTPPEPQPEPPYERAAIADALDHIAAGLNQLASALRKP